LHTYFLGREEVDAYVKDLVDRLKAQGELFPYMWCTLGYSGEELAVVISNALPKDCESKIRIIPMNYDRARKAVIFQDEQDKAVFANGKPVLILDSSVHSGNTMLAVFQTLKSLGAKNICSYSIVVKRNSAYIPNFFGVVIQPHDRAYFLLDKIPNNRLMPFGALRKLCQEDVDRKPESINSDLKSLNKVTWGDLWYDYKAKGSQIFVYENSGDILGFVSFIIKDWKLFIDGIAVDKKCERQGVGGCLMRWAETSARSSNCNSIELWAINNRIDFYKNKGGFESKPEELNLGSEKYTRMERKLLYNLDSCHLAGQL